jgi:hypothetical protein
MSSANSALAQNDGTDEVLIDAARKQLTKPYMTAPLPCMDPWVAGDDNRVVASPPWAQAEGIRPGDILTAIGGRRIVEGEPDGWLHAMRALRKGAKNFEVIVKRAEREVTVRLSCRSHVPYFEAERRLWMSITRRDWSECTLAALAAMDAFGRTTSTMMFIRLQCAIAARWNTDRRAPLLYDYAVSLLDEIPGESSTGQARNRETVIDAVSWLQKAGALASAKDLNNRVAALPAVDKPVGKQVKLTDAELGKIALSVAIGYGFVPDTPKGQIAQAWAREVFAEPLVIDHLSKVERDDDLESWAEERIAEGVPFLPDMYLRTRMAIVLRMLQTASPTECAQIYSRYGPKDQSKAFRAVLVRLSEKDIEGFLEIVREAIMVRLRQRQFVPYEMSQEEAKGLVVLISQAIPAPERDQWLAKLQRFDSLNDSDYCEVSKDTYRAILTLTGQQAGRGLRFEFSK